MFSSHCHTYTSKYNLSFFLDKICKLKTPIHQPTCYLENSDKNFFEASDSHAK